MTAHWGVPDPAAVQGTPEEIERAFRDAFFMLDRRIGLFLSLPLASLDRLPSRNKLMRLVVNDGHRLARALRLRS